MYVHIMNQVKSRVIRDNCKNKRSTFNIIGLYEGLNFRLFAETSNPLHKIQPLQHEHSSRKLSCDQGRINHSEGGIPT